jgi:hypothetical protein
MPLPPVDSLEQLIALALELGALEVPGTTRRESRLAKLATPISKRLVAATRSSILRGGDPLGESFSRLKSPALRRPLGATYTPPSIVSALVDWVAIQAPSRVVDPGAGTGRFIVAAGRRLPKADLVAVELDPFAALLLRANLHVAGLAAQSEVRVGDYRELSLPGTRGRTAFVGNPPYVRHHLISAKWKNWFARSAAKCGLKVSQLAGLHAHFILATSLKSSAGDIGAFVTAAEWLDVNYGDSVRRLLLEHLGLSSLHLVDQRAKPFADADTTAVITCFRVGEEPSTMRVSRVNNLRQLSPLGRGKAIDRERFASCTRWTNLMKPRRHKQEGYIELGELCQVHRGQVTGANNIWIAGSHSQGLPAEFLFPTITRARELFAAGESLRDVAGLRCVIDIPSNLDEIPKPRRRIVEQFLVRASALGAKVGYIARHRKAWWSVGLRAPAPILATYMARRVPAFVRNLANARHINIAHGIYPREPMTAQLLDALTSHLRSSVSLSEGRTYAGGLTKFEPKEMERLLVPEPRLLMQLMTETQRGIHASRAARSR